MAALCFYDSRGQAVVAGELIKSGGAGSVYHLASYPGAVAKIYHPGQDKASCQRKVRAMLALAPDIAPVTLDDQTQVMQLAWPTDTLHNERGEFIGFIMPELDVKRSIELEYILQPGQAQSAGIADSLGVKVSLAMNLASLVAAIHTRRHYIIDMKPVNLRFYRESLYVALLDCDGFSIQGQGERFPAGQFTPEYLAPEFQQSGSVPGSQEEQQDRFALAVIIFQLLNFGLHPYSGRPLSGQLPTHIPGRIGAGAYAYGQTASQLIKPAPASGHSQLPADVRRMFDLAFGRHAHLRPSAAQWVQTLRPYALRNTRKIVACQRDAKHQHFAGQGCALCERERQHKKALQAQKNTASVPAAARSGPRRSAGPTVAPPRPTRPQPRAATPQPVSPPWWLTLKQRVPTVVWHTLLALLVPLAIGWLCAQPEEWQVKSVMGNSWREGMQFVVIAAAGIAVLYRTLRAIVRSVP
ncbi:hypothetical protein [Entomohabitans teleogrylli]|uniref:hypothetical protein n=1 Tax=Entomohabitans teleogrylli TaxID=1384589 RepID=UPI00073D4017|nr:hypothetical protein [Entomohabitans teleogrylli]